MRAHLKTFIKDAEKLREIDLDDYNTIEAIKKNRFTSQRDNCEEGRLGAASPHRLNLRLHAFPPISSLHLQSGLYLPSDFQEIFVNKEGGKALDGACWMGF